MIVSVNSQNDLYIPVAVCASLENQSVMVSTTCPVRATHVHSYTVDAPLLFLLSLCHTVYAVIQRKTVGTLKVATDSPYSPYLSIMNYNSLGPFIMRKIKSKGLIVSISA